MQQITVGLIEVVFLFVLLIIFSLAVLGRWVGRKDPNDSDLAGRSLNRWLIGLSAGATGNSGFIVTGAVGLGFTGGIQWLVLPIAWLLGDLFFWWLFPQRINQYSRKHNSTTLPQLLASGLEGHHTQTLRIIVAVILAGLLALYTSAQWIAGDKFLSAAFNFDKTEALILFSGTIVAYSAIGGFRGSVYVDTLQAVLSLLGCILALFFASTLALSDLTTFNQNISAADPEFLSLIRSGGTVTFIGILGGYAAASVGFGLGQPQIISRYFAGRNPEETKAARWIYIGFLQFTWISMTVFGVMLRGIMPDVQDPEAGLSEFFVKYASPVLIGLVFAYIYSIIASTANSIVVASSQMLSIDILSSRHKENMKTPFWVILVFGVSTILLSFVVPGSVFTIAIGAVSKIGAAVAGPVVVKLMHWRHDARSLLFAVIGGTAMSYGWEFLGYSAFFNEAGPGIVTSLVINFLVAKR